MVRSDHGRTACNGPRLLVAAYGLDAVLSHEAFNTVKPADPADFSQVPEDATRTENAITCTVGISDEIEQAGMFIGVIAHGLPKLCVKPSASHPQNPVHQGNAIITAVLIHEAVLHSGSLSEYRADFS